MPTLFDWGVAAGFLEGFVMWLILDALNHKYHVTETWAKRLADWVGRRNRGE